jgi:thioredoxin-like negative regulator of GroEL
MSGLLYLGTEDFNKNLCNRIQGYSLILFYSTQCPHCLDVIKTFKKLPGLIQGTQIGIINISQNKAIITMSKETNLKIEYVPLIVLYIDGKPILKYDGPCTIENLNRFVSDVSQNIKKKQQFVTDKGTEGKGNRIPEYTIGIPISGDKKTDVCYLIDKEAYKSK